MQGMRFSFVVPAYSEEKIIEQTLSSIRNQTYRDYELIVVVRPSKDRTEEIAHRYADKVIIQKGSGLGDARNIGVANADGEMIICVDADTVIPPTFLGKLNEVLRGERAVAFVPKFYVHDGSLKGAVVYLMLDMLVKFVTKVKFLLYGMLLIIRKDSLLAVGGFKNTFGEDIDLALRLSKIHRINRSRIIKYCPELVAYTSSRRIKQLGFWRALKLWSFNLARLWLFHKNFIGYL